MTVLIVLLLLAVVAIVAYGIVREKEYPFADDVVVDTPAEPEVPQLPEEEPAPAIVVVAEPAPETIPALKKTRKPRAKAAKKTTTK